MVESKLKQLDPYRKALLALPVSNADTFVARSILVGQSSAFRNGFWEGVMAATNHLNIGLHTNKVNDGRRPWQVMKAVSGETWGI